MGAGSEADWKSEARPGLSPTGRWPRNSIAAALAAAGPRAGARAWADAHLLFLGAPPAP
jgi:hypothetical protein